jgi:hypothetical protein
MFESTSPFDDAMAKPFLDEPVKKRWYLGRTGASSKSSALSSHSWVSSSSWGSSSPTHPQNTAVPEYQAPDLPDLDDIEFKSPHDPNNDEELGLLLSPPLSIGSPEAYDLVDICMIRERHQDIADINQSLLELNEIEQGKKQSSPMHSTITSNPAHPFLFLS